MGTLNDCYRHAETRREYWTVGLGPIVPNRFQSRLLDILPYRSISIYYELRTNVCSWSQYHDKLSAYRGWRTDPAIYRDFVKVIQQIQDGDTPAASVNCNQFGARSQFAIWVDYNWAEFSWTEFLVELSWAIFTQLRGLRSLAHTAGSWIWT